MQRLKIYGKEYKCSVKKILGGIKMKVELNRVLKDLEDKSVQDGSNLYQATVEILGQILKLNPTDTVLAEELSKTSVLIAQRFLDNKVAEPDKYSLTVKRVLQNSLVDSTNARDPQTGKVIASPEEQLKKYDMALKIKNAKSTVDMVSEEIAWVKAAVLQTYPSPIVYGQVCNILEGKSEEAAEAK